MMRLTRGDVRSSARFAVQSLRIPPWVELLDMPVWITDLSGRMQYLNIGAEELLGRSHETCIGEPCHTVVQGTKPSGSALCGSECAIRRAVVVCGKIAPFAMCLPRDNSADRHAKIVVIAASPPDGSVRQLVHCAVDEQREHRIGKYLATIVGRNHRVADVKRASRPTDLTKREREILAMLAEDVTLHAIADRLFISYATVRNHVQHILPKLGVHSVLEAVAFYLLAEDE